MVETFGRDGRSGADGLGSAVTSATEGFGALASETRLRVLAAAVSHWEREREPVSYSELMAAADVGDSGKFNYHLDRLRGRFLTERDGYVPTAQAARAIDTVRSKRYGEVPADRQPVDGRCPVCGGDLEVGYDRNVYLGCSACDAVHVCREWVSPAALERCGWAELLADAERARRHKLAAALDGRCIECGCLTAVSFSRVEGRYEDTPVTRTVAANGHCTGCASDWTGSVGLFLLAHPRVREYCEDHSIDLDAKPFWHHEWALTDLTTAVHDEDPWRVEKVATVDGCRLAAVFDENGRVETVTHVDLRGGDGETE